MALSRITNYIEADGADLNLQSSDTTITASSVLGVINFKAPSEASGTDAILLASKIEAVAEGTFSASSNATKLSFATASSEAASEKMSLSSAGLLTVSGRIITDDTTEATSTTDGSLQTDGGLSVAKDIVAGDDVKLLSDSAVLSFGADSEIQLIHVADDGLILKHIGTGDGKEPSLTFQAGDNDIAQDDVLGSIFFQAPDEGAGTDAILVAAGIEAVSEGDFSASSNATSLVFKTGASETATAKWAITSGGSFQNQGTNTIDMNAGELILDADADTSITADTDDRIDFRIGGTDTVHIDATGIVVNINYPLYQIHINEASGGDTAAIFIDGPSDGYSALYFGDSDDIDEFAIVADHTNNRMEFIQDGAAGLTIHEDNQCVFATAAENPGNNVCLISLGYALGQNYGGFQMYTYSYYSDINFRLTNNDTLGGRNHNDFQFERVGSTQGSISVGTCGTSFNTSSDYRLKEDEKTIPDAIGTIKKLKPYNFRWKKTGERRDGFFAHEVDEVLSYAVTGEKDAVITKERCVLDKDGNVIATDIDKEIWEARRNDADDGEYSPAGETTYPSDSQWVASKLDVNPQSVDQSKIVPVLTAALQESITKIETLETKVKALEDA